MTSFGTEKKGRKLYFTTVLSEGGRSPNEKQTSVIGWVAIIASIIGSIVGLVTEWGIPTINSLVVASFIYWAFKVAVSRNQQSIESEESV